MIRRVCMGDREGRPARAFLPVLHSSRTRGVAQAIEANY